MRGPLLAVVVLAACGETYDPPPDVLSTNLVNGVFDLDSGALRVELTEPVDEETLRVRLLTGRYGTEQEVCLAGGDGRLPDGCGRAAELVAGDGDRVTVEDQRVVLVDAADRLRPFGLYVLLIDAGLTDDAGRRRKVPIDLRFQVAGDFEQAPTDFEPGMFLARLEVEKPIGTKVHFFFWIAVAAETGLARIWGCDADPKDPDVREMTSTDLHPDVWDPLPGPPGGYPIVAEGQVADTEQGRVVVLFPFDLITTGPAVTIEQAEFQGALTVESVEHGFSDILSARMGPAGDREVVKGQLSAPASYLGEGAETAPLGPGQGPLAFYRLTEEEQPPLESILPAGVTSAQVLDHPFDD